MTAQILQYQPIQPGMINWKEVFQRWLKWFHWTGNYSSFITRCCLMLVLKLSKVANEMGVTVSTDLTTVKTFGSMVKTAAEVYAWH